MCRHITWLGAARTLSSLLLEPEFSLLRQSYAPRRQRNSLFNGDGWGVGYYSPGRDTPARWRSNAPLWNDASFASVAPTIESSCFVAAVRAASPGMPLDESATAPFTDGRWLMAHNGVVDRDVVGYQSSAESYCDSAQMAALIFSVGPEKLGHIIADLGTRDESARLNVVVTDGRQVLATRWKDTLSVLNTEDGVVVASEPFDEDPRWIDIDDQSLVHVVGTTVTVTSIKPA